MTVYSEPCPPRRITDHEVTRSQFTNRKMYGNYCSIDRWEKSGGWISRSLLSLLVITKGLNWKGSWSWAICNLCGSQRSYWNRSTRFRHTDLFSSCKPLIFYAGSCFHLIDSEIRVYGPRSQTEDQMYYFHWICIISSSLRTESFAVFFQFQKH